MFKILLSKIVALFFCFNSFAAAPSFQDTPVTRLPKTKTDFLIRYGSDDTSRMIIEYFYFKRGNKKAGMYVAGGGLALTAVAALTKKAPVNPNIYAGLADAGLWLALFFFGTLTAYFSRGLMRYSKKRLVKTLAYYQSVKSVPEWLSKKYNWVDFCKRVYPKLKKG